MNTPKTVDVIIKLKHVREEKGWSVAEIIRRVDAAGSGVSPSVIHRIFKKDSETNDSFNYDTSIEPVASVLLTGEDDSLQADALLSIIGLKNEQLAEKQEQMDNMRDQFERRCEEYRSRIEFLRGQIERKDEYMGRKDLIIERLLDELHPPKK